MLERIERDTTLLLIPEAEVLAVKDVAETQRVETEGVDPNLELIAVTPASLPRELARSVTEVDAVEGKFDGGHMNEQERGVGHTRKQLTAGRVSVSKLIPVAAVVILAETVAMAAN